MVSETADKSTVYQSGQVVPVTGMYQVVGTHTQAVTDRNETNVRQLRAGELFPNYQGRAVAWHLEAKAG